ncbi:MAG: hypothetical protein ACXWYE_10830 [Actinomycetota bacterium]
METLAGPQGFMVRHAGAREGPCVGRRESPAAFEPFFREEYPNLCKAFYLLTGDVFEARSSRRRR